MEIQNFLIFGYRTFFAGITVIALHYQIKKQTKATSTGILLKTLDRVREPDFKDTIGKILNDKSIECEDVEIRKLLNYLEYIALFEDDGILDMNHICQMHGAILKKSKTDKHVQKIMSEVIARP